MRKNPRVAGIILSMCLVVSGCVGDGQPSGANTVDPLNTPTISPPTATISVSTTSLLHLTVVQPLPGTGTPRYVWTSSRASIATVDSLGNVIGVPAGQVIITATNAAKASEAAAAVITVAQPTGS